MPPKENHPLHLYLSISEGSIHCIHYILAQNNDKVNEQVIYYLRRTFKDTKTRYFSIEKVSLAFYFSCMELRNYKIGNIVFVVSKANVLKYMLTRPVIPRRIGKWVVALTKFTLQYLPHRTVKGQSIANFLVDHPNIENSGLEELRLNVYYLERAHGF